MSTVDATSDAGTSLLLDAVTPGVVDAAAYEAFLGGYCLPMAIALAWTLADNADNPGLVVLMHRADDDTFVHAMAEAADGSWWDVEGEHDPEGAVEAFEDAQDVGVVVRRMSVWDVLAQEDVAVGLSVAMSLVGAVVVEGG